MLIIGCDFHTRYQQIAMVDEATGDLVKRRLNHENGEAHAFYGGLSKPVRMGIEATAPIHWFESLLELVAEVSSPNSTSGHPRSTPRIIPRMLCSIRGRS